MYDDECMQAEDGRAAKMREWIDLDNKVRSLEGQKIEADMKLSELRPKRDKLGRQISEMVYPSEKVCEPSDFVKGVTDW